MAVEDWTLEAVQILGRGGRDVGLREIQRYIDEHHYEELAVDTIETALARLQQAGRLEAGSEGWRPVATTSKDDALKKLFGGS